MGRWRPAPANSTALITRAGFRRLQDELDQLWRVRRPGVVKALAAAAAEGDRSENAEYTWRKRELAEIDRRVRYLGRRLPALRVVEVAPDDAGAVYFGATAVLRRQHDGRVLSYRIVGPDETDAARSRISIDSPLARALLRRRVGDVVEAELPGGLERFQLCEVGYPEGDD